MPERPWFPFYPGDWRSDPRLRMCSMSARGLWIEMCCLMHEAQPYGHLLINGLVPTDAQLSVLTGAPPDQIPDLLGELESAGVFSRTSKGVVYSRRMTRDAKKAQKARANGKKGGNPTLEKQRDNPASDNPQDKPHDKPQRLEAISHRPDSSSSLRSEEARVEFDDWYSLYPHKVGRGQAERAFKAARKQVDLQTLIDGLERYKRMKPPDRPWCNPATWLNGQRWLDEEASMATGSGLDAAMAAARAD